MEKLWDSMAHRVSALRLPRSSELEAERLDMRASNGANSPEALTR